MNFNLFFRNINSNKQNIYIKKKYKPFLLGDLVRVGNLKKDGGYLITQNSLKYTHNLLSIGMGYDWSFEKHFFKRDKSKKKIISLDKSLSSTKLFKYSIYNLFTFFIKPSFKRIQRFLKFFDYYLFFNAKKCLHIRKNLALINDINNISLIRILNKFDSEKIMLKLDIEGNEYKVLKDILNLCKNFNIILIEFHNLNILKNRKKFDNFFKKIKKNFYLSHFHINNADGISNNFPKTLELTFENKKFFKNKKISKSNFNYPIKNLDYPSSKKAIDYKIIFN